MEWNGIIMDTIIIKLTALSKSLVGTTKDILEIINPYYFIQGLLANKNIGYKIAKNIEDNCVVSGIYIPEFKTYHNELFVPVYVHEKEQNIESRLNVEFKHILSELNFYFYFYMEYNSDNKNLFNINDKTIRLGKEDNWFIVEIVDEGKSPNILINHKDSNTYINVPFFTCSKMSFRRQKNLGNLFNQHAEGDLYQKVPCFYLNYEETVWNNLYFIKKININKDYSYFSTHKLYKSIKSKICEIYPNSEFSGHNEDGTPVDYDHIAILPFQFEFGINHYAMIVWILFPKKMKDGSDINEIVSIDYIMDIVEEEFGGECNNSYLQSDDSLKPNYYYHNLTDIIIDNPFEGGKNKERQLKKFEKLIKKSLSGNGINCEFLIESEPIIKSTKFLPEDIKDKYCNKNKIIIKAGSLRIRFSRKVKGIILIGSGKYIGYGVLLPIKGKKIW